MRIAILAPLTLLAFVIATACGGDDDTTATATPTPVETATSPAATDTPTAAPASPTATPLPETAIAIRVASRQGQFSPTLAEFRELPVTSVTLPGGETVAGVSIDTLAGQIDIGPAIIVTIEGQAAGFGPVGSVRRPLEEIGDSAVIVLREEGYLQLVSPDLDEVEWLVGVRSVGFE